MDLVLAFGHIISGSWRLAKHDSTSLEGRACSTLGVINEFALTASNLWYVFLAVDLVRAIRNPFR